MKRALVSGGGIAGLTSAYWLRKFGWEVTIVEKAPRLRTEGYMIYFFGNGWRVAEKMGLINEISNIKYPIENLQYVNAQGKPYFTVPIKRLKKAFEGKFIYLLRSDLERVLSQAAIESGAEVRYGTEIKELHEKTQSVEAEFDDGTTREFDIVVGADGVHSKVRTIVFGDREKFDHHLGYVASAFHVPKRREVEHSYKLYQEPNRTAGFYPVSEDVMDAVFMFDYRNCKNTSFGEKKKVLLDVYKDSGWIVKEVLENTPEEKISFFDNIQQIRMPKWSKGRVVLVGDACGCLTLISGQGASMAMLEAYVLAQELSKHGLDHQGAFSAYESFLKSDIEKRQLQAESFAGIFVPSTRLNLLFTRWRMRLVFSRVLINHTAKMLTGKLLINER